MTHRVLYNVTFHCCQLCIRTETLPVTPTPLQTVFAFIDQEIFCYKIHIHTHTHLHSCKMPAVLWLPISLISPGIRPQWPHRGSHPVAPHVTSTGAKRGNLLLYLLAQKLRVLQSGEL